MIREIHKISRRLSRDIYFLVIKDLLSHNKRWIYFKYQIIKVNYLDSQVSIFEFTSFICHAQFYYHQLFF